MQECYKELGYKTGDLANAELAAKEVLSIPIYPELKDQQKEYVVQTIRKFFQ